MNGAVSTDTDTDGAVKDSDAVVAGEDEVATDSEKGENVDQEGAGPGKEEK